MKFDVPVVIVGAGLAGLTTAVELGALGLGCVVLEAAPRIGGRIETITFADGATAEAGMEEFWQGGPVYPLLRALGLPLVEDRACSSMVLDGELLRYTADIAHDAYLAQIFSSADFVEFRRWERHVDELLRRLGEPGDPAPADNSDLRALAATPFAQHVRTQVHSGRVAEWIRMLVESETAIEWHRIGSLDGVAELRQFQRTSDGYGEANAHVVGGNGGLVQALAGRIPTDGIVPGATVTDIDDVGSHVTVRYRHADRVRTLRCEQVIVTAPVWSLGKVRWHNPPVSTPQTAGSYVKIVLRLRPDAEPPWSAAGPGLFTLLTDGPAGCLYLSETEGRAPVLTMLVHGRHARAFADQPGESVARQAVRDLAAVTVGGRSMFGGIARLVTETRVFNHQRAVSYWPVDGRRSRFDAQAARLRQPHGRVHFGGDTTESSHSDGAVRSAMRLTATVSHILGSSARPLTAPLVPTQRTSSPTSSAQVSAMGLPR